MSNENFNFNKLLNDSKETLLNPKGYFSTMPTSGGLGEPIIKALIYGTLAGLFALIWSVVGLGSIGGLGTMFGGAIGIMVLFWSIIGAIIGLFIGGVIMLVISAICGGNTDYEANVRVTASLMVLSPVRAFLGFFFGIGLTFGILIGILVSLYGLYLIYVAVVQSLKGKESSAKIVALVLAVLVALSFFAGRSATRMASNYSGLFDDATSEEVQERVEKKIENRVKRMAERYGDEEDVEEVEEVFDAVLGANVGYVLQTGKKKYKDPSRLKLMECISKMDKKNDFLKLSKENGFLQAKYEKDGYSMEYKDATGHYRTIEPIRAEYVSMMFLSYFENSDEIIEFGDWEEL